MDFRVAVAPNRPAAELGTSFGHTVLNDSTVHIEFAIINRNTGARLRDAKAADLTAVHMKFTHIYADSVSGTIVFKSIVCAKNRHPIIHMYCTFGNTVAGAND